MSRRPWGLAIVAMAVLASGCGLGEQIACARAADIETGWGLFREGRIPEARDRFEAGLACNPDQTDGWVGLGYVALRQRDDVAAQSAFDEALKADSSLVDALVGRAMIALRQNDRGLAYRLAEQALDRDKNRLEAREIFEQTMPEAEFVRRAPDRGDVQRPHSVDYPARVFGDGFQVRTALGGWRDFYIKGVNIGAALPGKHASQFPDSTTYAGWFREISELGANTIRVYTIHPPAFYDALRQHNLARRGEPLWLVHGVWTGLPPEDDFLNPEFEAEFWREMAYAVDAIHGRADIPPRSGHASGHYMSDVSEWTLAYVIGREWEPFSVVEYNELRPDETSFFGEYLEVEGGTPMDAWLAKASDRIIAYEMDAYNAQRPVAYTNWPTLDPLRHPTEATTREENDIRRELGEVITSQGDKYNDDATDLNAMLVRTTDAFPAGHFASYHIYPYHPSFMLLDPAYTQAESPFGPSRYYGYMKALKDAHPGVPVVVAEYGVPSSIGIGQLHPQGWHHGGHTEVRMGEINARLTHEIAAAGMAGGIIFEWIDEWWKKSWIVENFEEPLERNRMWLNRMDAEEQYGLIAIDAEDPFGVDATERDQAWLDVEPLYSTEDGSTLRATTDAAYLWLRYEGPEPVEKLRLGFDLLSDGAGDHRWPGRVGPPLPIGMEFALEISEREARLVVHPPYNPFFLVRIREGLNIPDARGALDGWLASRTLADGDRPGQEFPAGVFQDRMVQDFGAPWVRVQTSNGRYDSMRVVTNRPRFARDRTEYFGLGYDRGVLPRGPLPDGLWEITDGGRRVEVRIPWILLNVTDPSQRRALGAADHPKNWPEVVEMGVPTSIIDGIGVVAAAETTSGGWTNLPEIGTPEGDVAQVTWETWSDPSWSARRRATFDALRDAFMSMGNEVVVDRGDPEDLRRGLGG